MSTVAPSTVDVSGATAVLVSKNRVKRHHLGRSRNLQLITNYETDHETWLAVKTIADTF